MKSESEYLRNELKSCDSALDRKIKLPHQAASIAYKIYSLSKRHSIENDPGILDLKNRFNQKLPEWGFQDLVGDQCKYAIRLSESAEKLTYEEIHKLISLCDEIMALRWMGLTTAPDLMQDFESSVRHRIAKQNKEVRLVAEDKVEEWSRSFWWYSENLKERL
jgi:hypothetical protein